MEITYLGHSCFKIRGKQSSIVTDPYASTVGFSMPSASADIVTISHQHEDHNAATKVSGTARREEPYVVKAPGEYEVQGIGVFGWASYHDDKEGAERGPNTIYTMLLENIHIAHLGDLGHVPDKKLIEDIGVVDVLMVPVGGVYTIDAAKAVEVIDALEPSIVIPMHYRTDRHSQKTFGQLDGIETFLTKIEKPDLKPEPRLKITDADLDETTRIVWLSES